MDRVTVFASYQNPLLVKLMRVAEASEATLAELQMSDWFVRRMLFEEVREHLLLSRLARCHGAAGAAQPWWRGTHLPHAALTFLELIGPRVSMVAGSHLLHIRANRLHTGGL